MRLCDLWQQQLLVDCCKRLKDSNHIILETILNESLTKGYDQISALEAQGKQALKGQVEPARIDFLTEQIRIWDTILSKGSPEECSRLLILDVQRLHQELSGECFPKFQLTGREKFEEQPKQGVQAAVTLGRIVWFTIILRDMEMDSLGPLFDQIYTEMVRECKAWSYTQQTADEVLHQLLIIGYLYYSIEQTLQGKIGDQLEAKRLNLIQIWGRLSTSLELTEARFDELLTLSAQLYAASHSWSYSDYLRQTNQIERVGQDEKNTFFHYKNSQVKLILENPQA